MGNKTRREEHKLKQNKSKQKRTGELDDDGTEPRLSGSSNMNNISCPMNASRQVVVASDSKHNRTVAQSSVQPRCATDDEIEEEKELIETDALERMEKTLEAVRNNFNTVRTGRASPSLLDRIQVEYYGSPVGLRTIAQVSTPDSSTIMVTPFDKSSMGNVEKALLKSDLGLTPNNDGTVIRLRIPQLTQERRKELLKQVSKLAEDGKVALRNVRRDTIKAYEKMQKDKKISEDNLKGLSDDVQKMTDDYVKKIEDIFKAKEKELTTV